MDNELAQKKELIVSRKDNHHPANHKNKRSVYELSSGKYLTLAETNQLIWQRIKRHGKLKSLKEAESNRKLVSLNIFQA